MRNVLQLNHLHNNAQNVPLQNSSVRKQCLCIMHPHPVPFYVLGFLPKMVFQLDRLHLAWGPELLVSRSLPNPNRWGSRIANFHWYIRFCAEFGPIDDSSVGELANTLE